MPTNSGTSHSRKDTQTRDSLFKSEIQERPDAGKDGRTRQHDAAAAQESSARQVHSRDFEKIHGAAAFRRLAVVQNVAGNAYFASSLFRRLPGCIIVLSIPTLLSYSLSVHSSSGVLR